MQKQHPPSTDFPSIVGRSVVALRYCRLDNMPIWISPHRFQFNMFTLVSSEVYQILPPQFDSLCKRCATRRHRIDLLGSQLSSEHRYSQMTALHQLQRLPLVFRIKDKPCLLKHQTHVGQRPQYTADVLKPCATSTIQPGLNSPT